MSINSTDILWYQTTRELFLIRFIHQKLNTMNVVKACFLLSCLFFATLTIAQEKTEIVIPEITTEIKFEGPIFNYGTIESGEIVQTVFEFENTGSEPLIITNAKGSCGCTVPEWPKTPIAPGETGQLVVRFDSKNKVGIQSKRVTIIANTDPAMSYLTVKGEVIKSDPETIAEVKELASVPFNLVDIDATDVVIYPNPTSDLLTVRLDNATDSEATAYLYNASGQLVNSQQFQKGSTNEIQFDASELQAGTYTVAIKADGKHRIAKQVSIMH